MRIAVSSLFLILFQSASFCQKAPSDCEGIYVKAQSLFKKASYDSAINKLAAYKVCHPEGIQKADNLIKEIYKEVNRQRSKAIRQQKIAEKRAAIISLQKDSIEKENISNKIATQALQIKQLNPTDALLASQIGLCFSPNNPSLLEIRKTILSEEVLMKKVAAASPFATLCVKEIKGNRFLTGDILGYLCLWNSVSGKQDFSEKLFNGEIRYLENIDDSGDLIMYAGVEKNLGSKSNFVIGWINISTGKKQDICKDTVNEFKFLTSLGDSNTIIFSITDRSIKRFSFRDQSVKLIQSVNEDITGLACWRGLNKIYYATHSSVYSVGFELPVFTAPSESNITLLSFCEYRADLYIGLGSDLVIYDCTSKNRNLLYPLHNHMITSCSCSEQAGGFLTTSLDGYAALWTPTGNKNRVLKGNKPEVYSGFISQDGSYLITTGRRELAGSNSDTNTIKYWYLNTFQKKYAKDAHLFGSDCSAYDVKEKLFFTGGHDGGIKIWTEDLELINDLKIHSSGISTLFYDSLHELLAFGTFDGYTGFIKLSSEEKFKYECIKTHNNYVSGICVRNSKIYSSGKDGCVFVQDIDNKRVDSIYFNVELNSIQLNSTGTMILLSVGNSAIICSIAGTKKYVYKHPQRVFMSRWLANNQFITISGDVLRVWDVSDTTRPVLSNKNNISNEMTSLLIDNANKLIYTGTWSGYIICWNFKGNQLFFYDKLTSLANTNLIRSLTLNSDNSELLATDYNGTVSLWRNPVLFLENELNIKVNCSFYSDQLKK